MSRAKSPAQAPGAGEGSFRQAQAWLHTWTGLWFSWLLFAIFLTGSLAVFDEAISHWMNPEHQAQEEHGAGRPVTTGADMAQRLAWAVDYMQAQHAGAEMWEIWPTDAQGAGPLRLFWFERGRQYANVDLDPGTGAPLQEHATVGAHSRDTLGGHHFVDFHYELHAGNLGLWIVAAAALAMLVAAVSGVVVHKRIFSDFFTLRLQKGQRSWLDAHNAVAVLTLPFQFMIAYTGLAISGNSLMPVGIVAAYGPGKSAQQQFYAEQDGAPLVASGRTMPLPDLEAFARRGRDAMGQPVRAIVIDHPGDAAARIRVYGWNDEDGAGRTLSPSTGMASFAAADGSLLHAHRAGGVQGGRPAQFQFSLGGLHMAAFGGWTVKWLYFLCGLAGTAMMATGAVLFVVKRRKKHLGEFGAATARIYRLIEGLNIAAIAGLSLACIGYLWANRLLPADMAGRAGWELRGFFGLWAAALLHALVRRPRKAWAEQWTLFSLLCLLLPLLDTLTTGDHLLRQWTRGDAESLGVQAVAVLMGACALRLAVSLQMRQP